MTYKIETGGVTEGDINVSWDDGTWRRSGYPIADPFLKNDWPSVVGSDARGGSSAERLYQQFPHVPRSLSTSLMLANAPSGQLIQRVEDFNTHDLKEVFIADESVPHTHELKEIIIPNPIIVDPIVLELQNIKRITDQTMTEQIVENKEIEEIFKDEIIPSPQIQPSPFYVDPAFLPPDVEQSPQLQPQKNNFGILALIGLAVMG